MNGWSNISAPDSTDAEFDRLAEPLPEPPPMVHDPVTQIKAVDLASELENKKTYLAKEGEQKPFQARKENGEVQLAPPVDVYEPGFRNDLYEALISHFRKQKRIKENNQRLREKMGWRS